MSVVTVRVLDSEGRPLPEHPPMHTVNPGDALILNLFDRIHVEIVNPREDTP